MWLLIKASIIGKEQSQCRKGSYKNVNSGRHEKIGGGEFPISTLEPDIFYKTKIHNRKKISI